MGKRRRFVPLGRHIWGVVLRFLMWLYVRTEVRNAELTPPSGPGIVYYNHIHWLDPVVISGKLTRYNVPLTKIEARSWPVVGWLLRWYHVIFITRGQVDRTALQATWDVLAHDEVSVISPEGTRSLDGRLKTAKEGLVFIARAAPDAWLMPCAVMGTPQFSWSRPLIRHAQVTLTYGRPFRIRWPEGKASRELMREITAEIMAQFAAVLPPEMRGDYADSDPTQHKWLEPA